MPLLNNERLWRVEPSWPRAGIGHNGGPPLDDDPPGKLLFVRYRWKKAHAAAWKGASRDVTLFRLRRAEAAGVSYEEYMSTLLDTGRHLQREDVDRTAASNARDATSRRAEDKRLKQPIAGASPDPTLRSPTR